MKEQWQNNNVQRSYKKTCISNKGSFIRNQGGESIIMIAYAWLRWKVRGKQIKKINIILFSFVHFGFLQSIC